MGGVKWGYFLDLNTLHEFVVMMPAILGFIFEMAPTAITLKFFSLSAIKAAIRKHSNTVNSLFKDRDDKRDCRVGLDLGW